MKSYDLSHLRILVIDRQKFMCRLIADVLLQFGIRETEPFSDIETAYEAYKDDNPDIIITDWSPSLDGLALTKRIRTAKDSPNRFIPIIMVSAYAERNTIFTARDAGITEFLRKPITVQLLYLRMCSVIEHHRLFVKSRDFFGPDRRRRREALKAEERRVHKNLTHEERRMGQVPFEHVERRQGFPGYVPHDKRVQREADPIKEPEDVVYIG